MYTPPRVNPFSSAMPGGSSALNFSPNLSTMPAVKGPGFADEVQKGSFKDVMSNLANETERTLQLPDELMNRAITTGDVDIHEVMIANSKADMAINIASQVVTKVIQAYERVQQIQV